MEVMILLALLLSIVAAFPLALIALILAATNRSRINRLTEENKALRARLNAAAVPKQPPVANPPVQRPQTPVPTAATPATPTAPGPIFTPVPPPAVPAPKPVPSPVPAASPATAVRTEVPIPEKHPDGSYEKPQKNLENIFGKNILAIAATALIFVGLIAFGVLVFTQITDTVKIVAMFLASFAITGAGIFLTRKNRNAFTEILTGCGVGTVYISILVTHLYFDRLGDIAAFGLILLWGAGLFALSRWLKGRSLVYIAHFGCILSTVLSVGYGQATEKYIEITVYQLITFSLLFFANRKEKILHTLSCYVSMILNGALCLVMTEEFFGTVYGNATTAVLGILCLALNLFNGVLYVLSLNRPSFAPTGHSLLTNVAYFATLFLGGFLPGRNYFEGLIFDLFPGAESGLLSLAAYCLTLLVPMAIVALAGIAIYTTCPRKVKIHALISAQLFFALLFFWASVALYDHFATLPLTLLFATVCGATSLWMKKKGDRPHGDLLWGFGLFFLFADALLTGLYLPEFEIFGVFYSLILIAFSFGYLWIKTGSVWSAPILQLVLIDLHFIFTACNFAETVTGQIWLGFILATLGNIALSLAYRWAVRSPNGLQKACNILLEIGESVWIFILSLIVITEQDPLFAGYENPNTGYFLALSVLIFLEGLLRLPSVIARKNPFMTVWYAVKFTYLTLVPIGQFTTLFEEQFVLSIAFMILAGLCIFFGFMKDLKAVRVYGLILILASVLKMVIMDVWNQESLIRVISLIAGGIICFAISAGYSAMEKRQAKKSLTDKTNA